MLKESKTFAELSEGERAEYVPEQWLGHGQEAPAFIFTSENLGTIKRYEKAVRALPADHHALSKTLDFDVVGLDIMEVLEFHDGLRSHVNSWGGVERSCKKMAVNLQTFAGNLLQDGWALLEVIEGTDAWKTSKENNTLNEVDLNQIVRAPLSLADVNTVKAGVDIYLRAILQDIEERLKDIEGVSNLVNAFISTITTELKPKVDQLVVKVANRELAGQLAALEEQIAAADIHIEALLQQYKKLVGVSFSGVAFGPLGLIITGGIFGSKAEKVRAEKNHQIRNRDLLSAKRAGIIAHVGGFNDFKGIINDLQFRLVDVQVAATYLWDVWLALETFAETSIQKLSYVDTNVALVSFGESFKRVIKPWRQIKGFSENVSRLFNQAIR
ncbi:alpha-xenorhabdolysin family binary toxin subunit A [Pseudomonas sp. Teo4]|uniref:alpha-xenorhabdolysin family binary toxin subunit A n=1 Tax=Pseudomonas sp. Teo4 TaxID=3064528 RepID=UPI002ABABBE7|nr:alpha-xenorhabdolysin family binary toxin subunit A [Pseudomonas sp. Teo4]MDZ3995738.1 hypothetical protein [Pseudomonas sp. Teo4]